MVAPIDQNELSKLAAHLRALLAEGTLDLRQQDLCTKGLRALELLVETARVIDNERILEIYSVGATLGANLGQIVEQLHWEDLVDESILTLDID